MSLLIDEHRQFLQDRARLDVFQRAIADVVRPGSVGAVSRQSTLRGMLVVKQDLIGAAESATPTLNAWAAARATVLALCDGQRTVCDIERGVFERHCDLSSTEARAQVCVAEVISRYADVPRPSIS